MNFDIFNSTQKSLKKDWMDRKTFILGTVDNLASIIDRCIQSGRYACDLETSGVDDRVFVNGDGIPCTVDTIAGVGLSPDGETGYYTPLRHAKVSPIDGSREFYECNIPLDMFAREIKRLTDATEAGQTVAVFHNAKFDQEFMQFNGTGIPWGEWEKPSTWDDTMILCYLRNARARNKRLKDLSAQPPDMPKESWAYAQCGGPGLGMEMIELYELFGHDKEKLGFDYDFTTLDPTSQEVLWYAASDVICTWLLYPLLSPAVLLEDTDGNTQKATYTIEKSAVTAERWMERCLIHVDLTRVSELILLGHKEWWDAIQDVYQHATEILGRNVMPGLYIVLRDIIVLDDPKNLLPDQIDVAERQAKPMYGDKPGLIVGKDNRKFPVTYDVASPQQLGLMFEEMDVPGLKFTEKSGQVATGKDELDRVIAEAGSHFPFMSKIKRFREVNKALSTYLYPMIRDIEPTGGIDPTGGLMRISFNGRKVDTGRYATPAKENGPRMAGWPKLNLQSAPNTAHDPKNPRPECMRRIREVVTARPTGPGKPKKYIAAADFSGEELRLVTNLSGEPKWTTEFFHCSSCDRTFSRDTRSATCKTPFPPPPRCPNCGSDKIGDLHTLTAMSIYGNDAPSRPEWKVLRGHAKCVHPDTFIALNGGISRMGSLATGPVDTFLKVEGARVGTPDGQVRVLETYNGGVKPLYNVVTRRCIITCSGQHKFMKPDGTLVCVDEGLSSGMVLQAGSLELITSGAYAELQHHGHEDCPDTCIKPNHALAYFAGLFQGDGTKQGTRAVALTHGDVGKTDQLGVPYLEWQDRLVEACVEAGFRPIRRKKQVYLGSRHTMSFLKTLGLLDQSNRVLRIPLWVANAGHDAILHYLGGLWDTDGTVAKDGSSSCTTKDAIFGGQIAAVLQAVGILPTCEACWNSTYEKWYYRIHIRAREATKLKPYMKQRGKTARLRQAQSMPISENRVLQVIPAGAGPCMDIHIDSPDHLYWCNGLITHNSVNFGLCYGGGGKAVQTATGCDKNEGWRIKNAFDKTYSGLRAWWDMMHKFAQTHGFVRTAFGRKYPLPDINHPDGFFKSKAERNAVNGPIQGCLHGDSRIPTDLGVLRIEDLVGKKFQVWTGTEWAEGTAFPSGPKYLVLTTLTSGGVVRTSPDHRFRVYDHDDPNRLTWVRQEDLTPDMWVCMDAVGSTGSDGKFAFLDTLKRSPDHNGFDNCEELWEMLGLVIGDGSIREDGFTIHVGGINAEEQAQFYKHRFETALLGLDFTLRKSKRDLDKSRKLPRWQVHLYNWSFREFCFTLGVGDWNTYTKRIPEAVWHQPTQHRAAFLRGYFSANGCVNVAHAIDVRSVNQPLLQDIYGLLRSIGIRCAARLDSMQVGVKDAQSFQRLVGFLTPKKQDRLGNIPLNPWTGQWHALPPALITWVGNVVYGSTIYASLPEEQKSAVLRLVQGSGSKPQCLRYLAQLPSDEVPKRMRDLLRYDYEQVVSSDPAGTKVEMYDIEVQTEEHAFVSDGVIVHNSGADVIKIAMSLVYRECKRRGWLEKCLMVASMHDELIFEIDADILEEALPLIVNTMASNNIILGRNWIIPLTCDVEIGPDWTVPWDINGMTHKEVRFLGNTKLKDRKQCPEGVDFDSLPTWPEELKPWFRSARGENADSPLNTYAAPVTATVAPQALPMATEASVPPDMIVANIAHFGMPKPMDNTAWEFKLDAILTPDTVTKLARVIVKNRGRGMTPLKIRMMDGTYLDLDHYLSQNGVKTPILVNPGLFEASALDHGLIR